MKTLIDGVLALPFADRLDHALFLIGELTGGPDRAESWLHATYRLTPSEIKVFCALNAASPRILSKQAIYTALYGAGDAADLKLVDIYIHKLRAKMGNIIQNRWAVGYAIPKKIALPGSAAATMPSRPSATLPWTVADDAELVRMRDTGSDLSAIADELDRSERGVLDRLRMLRQAKPRAA